MMLPLDAKTADEAHAVMDTLPLSKESLMYHEYIFPWSPMPLRGLISDGPAQGWASGPVPQSYWLAKMRRYLINKSETHREIDLVALITKFKRGLSRSPDGCISPCL